MKKIIIILCLVCFTIIGCGDNKVLNGVEYETYGFINKDTVKSDKVNYRVITGNVVWSIILSESVAFPIYFIGFSLYEPVSLKPIPKTINPNDIPVVVNSN